MPVLLLVCYVVLHAVLFVTTAGALEDGIRCGERALPSLASYESNVLYALRFMVDTNMGGGQWLEIPAGVLHKLG
jgi:DNA polymerase delta subunit 1